MEVEGEYSIAHAAAAVVRVCVHGDNVLACKLLHLIAFLEKTKMTMLRTDVVGSKHPSSRNVKPNTTERIVVNRLLEMHLGLAI